MTGKPFLQAFPVNLSKRETVPPVTMFQQLHNFAFAWQWFTIPHRRALLNQIFSLTTDCIKDFLTSGGGEKLGINKLIPMTMGMDRHYSKMKIHSNDLIRRLDILRPLSWMMALGSSQRKWECWVPPVE